MAHTPPTDPLAALEPPPTDPDALEMVATLRGATALWLLMVRRRITTRDLAAELGCTERNARLVMERLSLSRRFAVTYERPHWTLWRREKGT